MANFIKSDNKLLLVTTLSFVTYVLSNGKLSIPFFAWIYPMLFLWIAHLCSSSKTYFIIFGIYGIGFVVRFVNVIGMNLGVCIAAAVLVAAISSLPYIYWQKSKRNFRATITFAAAMVIVEYMIYIIYPILGGLSDAYTQYENSVLLQILTITGIYGISFIMYWTAAIAVLLYEKRNELHEIQKSIFIYCAVMGVVFLYGIAMLYSGNTVEKSVRMAAVTVPVSQILNEDEDVYAVFYTDTFTDKNMANTKRKLSQVINQLFAKTVKEAQADAKIVFWSELNGTVLKEDEADLLQRASEIANEQDIYLVVSLLVKTPYENLKENKTVTFSPQGKKISEYYKFGRSIGELCLKGDGLMKSFDTEYGRIAPFICSDMAFSSKIRQAGKNDVDILIVPASDWEEMTGIAVKTAVVRGVENGCGVIRHTNKGTSVVSDARGDILARTSYFASDTKTISAQVITNGRFTLYSYIGDVLVFLCGVYLLGSFIYSSVYLFQHHRHRW